VTAGNSDVEQEAPKQWNERHADTLRAAIAQFGEVSQTNMLLEEMAELAVAIAHLRRGKVTVNEVIGEIADVEVMLEQLKLTIPDGGERVATARDVKLKRLKRRITAAAK